MNTTHHHTSTSDFPIAIALLALLSVSLLIISYYIFIIKCCFNIHTLDPLRRFSFPRNTRDSNLPTINPTPNDMFMYQNRGLDEWLINNIPAFQYKQETYSMTSSSSRSFRSGCIVCLNDFHDQEMLRILPRCSHIFHLDCIDVWLLNNASCPLCRSSISGRIKYPIERIIAPSSSPIHSYDPDFVVIELDTNHAGESRRKCCDRTTNVGKVKRFSIMGDECIDVNRVKDEQFCVDQPIRRSFSLDSVVDRGLYLHVQEIITRQNRVVNGNHHRNQGVNDQVNGNNLSFDDEGQSNGRFRRGSFFSFGHSRGSSRSSSIQPLEIDR